MKSLDQPSVDGEVVIDEESAVLPKQTVETNEAGSVINSAADALINMRIAATAEATWHTEVNRVRLNETTRNYNEMMRATGKAGIDSREMLKLAIAKMAERDTAARQELDQLNKETGGFPNNGTVSKELYRRRTELEEVINASGWFRSFKNKEGK